MGAKVPQDESSRERKLSRTFLPLSESSSERISQGAKGPLSEFARVLLADLLQGVNWLGSEKAR